MGENGKTDFYEGLNMSEDKLSEKKEWEGLFPSIMVEKARKKAFQDTLEKFEQRSDWYGKPSLCTAFFRKDEAKKNTGAQKSRAGTRRASYGGYYSPSYFGNSHYFTRIQNPPLNLSATWKDADFSCNCPEGQQGMFCIHKAALLVRWEKEHGPWMAYETDVEYQERMRRIAVARELDRRQQLKEKLGMEEIPASSCFSQPDKKDELVFFDIEKILEGKTTTPYYRERAKELALCYKEVYYGYGSSPGGIELVKERNGELNVLIRARFEEECFETMVNGAFNGSRLLSLYCNTLERKNRYMYFPMDQEDGNDESGPELDEYKLAALKIAFDYLDKNKTGLAATDEAAGTFFKRLEASWEKNREEKEAPVALKRKNLLLEPRIIIENGEAKLGFKAGYAGGRSFVLKNISSFVGAYQSESSFDLSKKESVDFSEMDFRDSDQALLEFLIRRVGETRDVNAKLSEKARYGYGVTTLKEVASSLELKGSLLDGFYDAAEGLTCEYQDKTNGIRGNLISVGHKDMKIRLKMDRLADARDKFAGVAVSGFIPVLIKGRSGSYILNSEALSRISADELRTLAPYRSVADPSGYFRFQVGFDRLQEFYYRVVPALLSNPGVELDDECTDELQTFLPPEPDFTFYLDYDEDLVSCRCDVSYGGKEQHQIRPDPDNGGKRRTAGKRAVKKTEPAAMIADGEGSTAGKTVSLDAYRQLPDGCRDKEQEERVRRVLNGYFDDSEPRSGKFLKAMGEEEFFDFLLNGIPNLEHYGTVKGTDAFRKVKVRPVPQITVGVSVDSGLMDFTVTSKDLSEDELLEILNQYQLRKRYHRLKSGEYIDLGKNEELDSLGLLFSELDILPKEVIRKKVQIPIYRALYLDRLLEEHDALVSSRDRTFRALARNFRTVKDADYELPQSLGDTLRPYQAYGFKWLKTVENSGFGGILADEMGLGKTLQMISLLLYDKETDNNTGSLIICPASLVYNWQEEVRRFAPALSCVVLAGTPSARKKALLDDADIYVTSYDLARRDITLLEEKKFHICVLDEAQNIKNAKAGVTKAVKAIKADHRFALTGTPIENRLAELWSIFDFLMPGFLYGITEFEKRFERLITKEKDEKTIEKLRAMTSPFILRRRKEEVLKDLPAKLEEVRYARVTGEQQKLYDAQVMRMKGMLTSSPNSGEEKVKIFAELTRIRQICCDPSLIYENYHDGSAKREACLELIRSAIDGGHRMLLFSQFTSMLALLEEDLKNEGIEYYKIIGSTPKEKRISLVHAFNDGDVPVFLISLKAGGAGLNLTGADVVIHYDPWWNLAVQNQATDRAHRIGQTKQVSVYKLVLKDTIEERIIELQDAKKDLAEAILEGEASSLMSMSNEELLALLD